MPDLIHDWNVTGPHKALVIPPNIEVDDETLRDGLQSPSVKNPTIETKVASLHHMAALGIQGVDIGLPAAGPHVEEQCLRLAKEIVAQDLALTPNCACRTVVSDIQPVVRVAQATGLFIEASTFIGSSPIRQFAEGWDLDRMLRSTEEAVTFAIKQGLGVMYVTEDTTRADPETLRKLYTTAIECGAKRICLADTVGHATPPGVVNLVSFMKEVVAETGEDVQLDWHGHMDRGLGVINTLIAAVAGVHRIHGTILGVGERVGNTPLETLLVNLKLLDAWPHDLTTLKNYVDLIGKECEVGIPNRTPVFGEDAFRTGTGVHASAIIKAIGKNDPLLADLVYSGVPAGWFGREQKIEIGPMSGRSNVIYWLKKRGIPAEDALVDALFEKAKNSSSLLVEKDIMDVIQNHSKSR